MSQEKFPFIPLPLLEDLERRFPERAPSKGETLEELMFRGGQVAVVRFLREQLNRQNPLEKLNVQGSEG